LLSLHVFFLKKTAADNMRGLKQELLKLQLIVDYFVPEDVAVSIKDKATWDEDNATYILPRTGLMGNNLRGRRPISAANSRRPETEYARRRKAQSKNPRYRSDNIVDMELDMPERTTSEYESGGMARRNVQAALDAALQDGQDDEEILLEARENLPDFNPYLNYQGDEADRDREEEKRQRQFREEESKNERRRKKERNKSSSSSGRRKRPSTAGRRGRNGASRRDEDGDGGQGRDRMLNRESQERDQQEQYPEARGLVGR